MSNVCFGTPFIAEGGKCSKIHCVEKTMPCVFFQKWLKKIVYKKSENITSSVFQKRSAWCLRFFDKLVFINHFLKNTQGIVFSTQWIFWHLPPSAINGVPNRTFDPIYFWKNLLYRQNNCIYLFKKYHPYWIMTHIVTFPKIYLFMKISQLVIHI